MHKAMDVSCGRLTEVYFPCKPHGDTLQIGQKWVLTMAMENNVPDVDFSYEHEESFLFCNLEVILPDSKEAIRLTL